MKGHVMIAVMAVQLIGCIRSPIVKPVHPPSQPIATTSAADASANKNDEVITFANLLGTWLHLDSEGDVAKDGDRLVFAKGDGEYIGTLFYQGSIRECQLLQMKGEYLVVATTGERYRITRLESINHNENGGISLNLIVGPGLDDIGLGFFQREDILKQLEGQ